MSCHRAKAEPRDERKELDGDRLDGDGVPSDPSSLSPSSSWPGSFPCCRWISLLMATSLYSWYKIAAGKGMARNVKQETQQSVSLKLGQQIKETYNLVKNVINGWNLKQLEWCLNPPLWIFFSFCKMQAFINSCTLILAINIQGCNIFTWVLCSIDAFHYHSLTAEWVWFLLDCGGRYQRSLLNHDAWSYV